MAVENSLNQVLQVVRKSCLHFSAQETPHSLYISLRKKLIGNKEISPYFTPTSSPNYEKKIDDLSKQCKTLENALEGVKRELEQEISDHEETVKLKDKLVKQLGVDDTLKKENEGLKADIDNLDSDLKLVKKNVKSKEKELHDLKKSNEILNDNLEAAKSDFKMLSAKVKKHEKEENKKSKVNHSKDTQNNMEFHCELCPIMFESHVKLKVHVKLEHFKINSSQTDEIIQETKSSQTQQDMRISKKSQTLTPEKKETEDDFQVYSCFYCDREITSGKGLVDHRKSCMTPIGLILRKSTSAPPDHLLVPKSNQFDETILTKPKSPTKFKPLPSTLPPQHHAASLSLPVSFPLQPSFSQSFSYQIQGLHLPICEHCGWQSSCGTDLVEHKKVFHRDSSNPI